MVRRSQVNMAAVFSLGYFVILWALFPGTEAVITEVNLSNCNQPLDYNIQDGDSIIRVFALSQSNIFTTQDGCDVKVTTDQGHKLEYIIDTVGIRNCGVEIQVFDNTTRVQMISCKDNNSAPIHGKINLNILQLNIRKIIAESALFSFNMRIKNDLGFPLDSGDVTPKFVGDGADIGVIAGVGVAGVIVVIALILIAVYCCMRSRNTATKDQHAGNAYGESSVYTSGTSQAIFASGQARYPKGKYGSMEDIQSSASSQDRANGAYANPAYTKDPSDRKSERHASVGKARGKTGFTNEAYDTEDNRRFEQVDNSWEEKDMADANGNKRMSRRDGSQRSSLKPMKSAMKKNTAIEMSQVNTHSVNGILKTRAHSPNRSQTSSTDASLDANALIYGYGHQGKDQPNVKHKPVIERKRSRSGTRSHRSGSSGHSKRSQSPDKKKVKNSRMYGEVFIDDRSNKNRSSGRRARSDSSRRTRSERTSDSMDSGSSTASQSRKVSMNPSGKRVHIKGEETDI